MGLTHNRLQTISPESFDDEGGFRSDPHACAEAKTRCKHQEAPVLWAPDHDDDDEDDDDDDYD